MFSFLRRIPCLHVFALSVGWRPPCTARCPSSRPPEVSRIPSEACVAEVSFSVGFRHAEYHELVSSAARSARGRLCDGLLDPAASERDECSAGLRCKCSDDAVAAVWLHAVLWAEAVRV